MEAIYETALSNGGFTHFLLGIYLWFKTNYICDSYLYATTCIQFLFGDKYFDELWLYHFYDRKVTMSM